MPDNITIAGRTFAADEVEINGNLVLVERSKLGYGPEGQWTADVSDASPLPVGGTALLAALAALLKPADIAALATAAKQDTASGTLSAILAKLSSDPATQTTLLAVLTKLSDGSQLQKKTPLTASATARVAASATAITLQASNAARRSLKVFNDSPATLTIKDGASVTSTDYSVQVSPGGYYEWPLPIYTGVVTGLWSAASGAAQITEGT